MIVRRYLLALWLDLSVDSLENVVESNRSGRLVEKEWRAQLIMSVIKWRKWGWLTTCGSVQAISKALSEEGVDPVIRSLMATYPTS